LPKPMHRLILLVLSHALKAQKATLFKVFSGICAGGGRMMEDFGEA
jgi:hypothetical protein